MPIMACHCLPSALHLSARSACTAEPTCCDILHHAGDMHPCHLAYHPPAAGMRAKQHRCCLLELPLVLFFDHNPAPAFREAC